MKEEIKILATTQAELSAFEYPDLAKEYVASDAVTHNDQGDQDSKAEHRG